MAEQVPGCRGHEAEYAEQIAPAFSKAFRLLGPICLVVLLGFIHAACGVELEESERPRPPVCAAGQIDGELILMSRADRISPAAIDKFERRYAIDVVSLVYEDEDDLLARVTAGAGGFDVIVAADYLAEIMRRGDALFPLDPIALPGRMNLGQMFADFSDEYEPFYSIPLVWGTVGMGMNLNMVGEDVDPSWGLIFDPRQAWVYAGRVSFLEEGRQVMAAAMFYLGYSPNLDDKRRVAEAADVVAQARGLVRGFDSENYASDLVEGGLDVAHGRSDMLTAAIPSGSSDFRYIIPKEGAVIWLETVVIPTTSQHPCTAHSFIDFLLEPQVGAEVANYSGAATPNELALPHVLPELAANPVIYPSPEVRSRLEILDYSEDLNRLYAEEFIYTDST